MTGGTANGTQNNQEKGFQFGVNVGTETGLYMISSGILGLTAPGQLYDFDGVGEVGIQMGDGTQSNFIKLVFTETHLIAAQELNDVPDANPIMRPIPVENRPLTEDLVEIGFEVDPVVGAVQPYYKFGNADKVFIGTIQTAGSIKEAIQTIDVPLAIGIFGTSNDWDKDFIGVWNYFKVVGERPYIIKSLGNVEKIVNDTDKIIDLNQHFNDNDGVENLDYHIVNNSNPVFGAIVVGNLLTLKFPNEVNSSEITIRASDQNGLYIDQSFTVSTKLDEQIILRINAGGAIIADETTNPNWMAHNTTGATNNEFFNVNTGLISTNAFSPSNRHSSVPAYISDQMYAQIFNNERYSSQQLMQYNIPLENGEYKVNLYMGNGFDGTSQPGQRVFNVLIEGQPVISQLDLSAKYGHRVGGMEQIPVTITDGELNIGFQKSMENPLVNGIEIIQLFGLIDHTPILFTPVENQIHLAGEELDGSIYVLASGGDGNLNFHALGLPPGIVIEPTNGTFYGQIEEDAHIHSPYSVTVVIDDEDGTDSDAESFEFTWTVSPPLSLQQWIIKHESQNYTGRHENSFVQAGDKFYLLGGRENPRTVEIYDYTNDTWESLSNSSPLEFNHFQAATYQGLIWVIAAFKDNNFPSEQPAEHIWAFDPVNKEWIQGPEIPEQRRRGSAGVVLYNNKFYIVNGNKLGHNGQYVNFFDEYDPQTGEWTVLQDSPQARDHFFATVVDNKLYVVSGRRSGGPIGGVFGPVIPEVDVYNFTTQTWATLPQEQNLPTPRAAALVNNYLNKIIVAGGEVPDNNQALSVTEMYDPEKEEWQELAPLNFARHGTQGIVSGKGLYVLSGSPNRGGGNMKNMEVFGIDQPQGTVLVASQLITEVDLEIAPGQVASTPLQAQNGNTGIFLKSINITGSGASNYQMLTETSNRLIRAGSYLELEIERLSNANNEPAFLNIQYGSGEVKTIELKGEVSGGELPVVSLGASTLSGTVPLTVMFTSSGSTGVGTLSYSWDFGDGTTSTTANPTHTFEDVGNFTVTLSITDENENVGSEMVTISVSGEIIVDPGVSSSPSASQTSGSYPLSVTFSSEGSTGPGTLSYLWDFGDGNSTTDPNPTYVFHASGIFEVTLQVVDEKGDIDSNSLLITVLDPGEIPAFELYLNTGTSNTAVFEESEYLGDANFPSYYTGGSTYANNSASSQPLYNTERFGTNLSYAIPVPNGVYTVVTHHHELWFGRGGRTASSGQRVFSISLEGVTVRQNLDMYVESGNQPLALTFTNIEVEDGVLNLGLVSSANNASISGIAVVSSGVITLPVLASASASVSSGVAPMSVAFTSSGSQGTGELSYQWDFGDGTTSTSANAVHEFTSPGNYNVTLTVTDGTGDMDVAILGIEVKALEVELTASTTSGMAPLEVSFTGSGTLGTGPFSYQWDFGDGNISMVADPVHVFEVPGSYLVALTVEDGSGNSGIEVTLIEVLDQGGAPAFELYLNTGTSNTTVFEEREYVGDANFPAYYIGGSTYANNNASSIALFNTERFGSDFTYNIPIDNGIYQVKTYHNELYFGKGGPAATAGRRVFSISIEGEPLRSNIDLYNESNNQPIEFIFPHVEVVDGILSIQLTSTVNNATISGLSIVSSNELVKGEGAFNLRVLQEDQPVEVLDLKDIYDTAIIYLFPNPADHKTTLQLSSDIPINSIFIYDMNGRSVFNMDIKGESKTSYQLPLHNLSQGVYIVCLVGPDGIFKQIRLIKTYNE